MQGKSKEVRLKGGMGFSDGPQDFFARLITSRQTFVSR